MKKNIEKRIARLEKAMTMLCNAQLQLCQHLQYKKISDKNIDIKYIG